MSSGVGKLDYFVGIIWNVQTKHKLKTHWKLRMAMMPTLPSLVVMEVVIMTPQIATRGEKVGIMTNPGF